MKKVENRPSQAMKFIIVRKAADACSSTQLREKQTRQPLGVISSNILVGSKQQQQQAQTELKTSAQQSSLKFIPKYVPIGNVKSGSGDSGNTPISEKGKLSLSSSNNLNGSTRLPQLKIVPQITTTKQLVSSQLQDKTCSSPVTQQAVLREKQTRQPLGVISSNILVGSKQQQQQAQTELKTSAQQSSIKFIPKYVPIGNVKSGSGDSGNTPINEKGKLSLSSSNNLNGSTRLPQLKIVQQITTTKQLVSSQLQDKTCSSPVTQQAVLRAPINKQRRVTKLSLSKKVQSSLLNGGGDIPSVQAPTESPNETSVPLRQASDILVLESQNDFLSVSTAAGSSNVAISNNANTNEFQDPIVLRSAFQATLPEYEHFVVALDQAHPYPKIENMNRGEMCTALLRVNLRSKEEALQWLADYQTSSSTDWRVRRTFEENTPCIIFKKEFRCHNNTLAQYRPKTKKCRYKHTLCEASLMITVKNFKMQRSSDKFLKTAPCEIVINNFHNHPLAVADSLRLRRPTQQVKDAFLELYRSGHSPSSAHRTFTFDLQMKHGDEFFKVLADGAQCPTKQWCYQLYYKTFKAHYGVPDGQEMLQSLQDAVNKYNTDCGSVCAAVEKTDSDVVVAICTPLMKRVHLNLKTCSEMVFMDAGGGMDRQNNRIFVILSPSVAGALPVGLILTSSESEEMVTIGLKLLMTLVPPNGFYGRGSKGPEIFMTDDSTAERNAIMNVFPDAILLLCLFHILQAFWKYVTLSEHKVSTNDQLHIFNLFRDWCYVEEEKEFMESYSKILEYSEVSSNSILKKHVIDLYDRRSEWALCFRSDYLTRGNNTNNYAESSIRQMKESIMERTRAYSLVQLFDFMTSRLELYYERRISFVLNNRTENFYKSKHFTRPEKLSDLICSATSEENFYIVENLTKKTKYVVDMNLELCGCPVGRNGKACKHQFAVIEEFKLSSSQFLPFQDEEAKLALHKIMSTVEAPPGWYGSLKSGPTQFSTGFPAVPVPSTITSGENNGDSAIDNELGEDMQVVSSDNNAVDISAEANNAIEMWSQFDAYVLNGLKNRPEVFVGAVQRFMDGFRRAKSSSENAVLSAMHNFNRVVKYNRPKHNQGNIGVNRLSVQRRKRPVGGRQCVQTGRPARAALTAEHGFARQSKKPAWERKAPPKRAFPHQVTERAELMSYNKKPKKC